MLAFGPCAASYLGEVVEHGRRIPLSLAQLNLITTIPANVPTLRRQVHEYITSEIKQRIASGANVAVSWLLKSSILGCY